MKLTIHCENENKNIDIDDNISIVDLRVKIASLFQTKPRNIDLQYGRVILLDSKRVKDYGMTENSMINIINQRIDITIIDGNNESVLSNLEQKMKILELKKKYSANQGNMIEFYYNDLLLKDNDKSLMDYKIKDDSKIYVPFRIYAKYNEATFIIEAYYSIKIIDLKQRIINKIDKSISKLELTFGGDDLPDYYTAKQCKLAPNETVILTSVVVGGGN